MSAIAGPVPSLLLRLAESPLVGWVRRYLTRPPTLEELASKLPPDARQAVMRAASPPPMRPAAPARRAPRCQAPVIPERAPLPKRMPRSAEVLPPRPVMWVHPPLPPLAPPPPRPPDPDRLLRQRQQQEWQRRQLRAAPVATRATPATPASMPVPEVPAPSSMSAPEPHAIPPEAPRSPRKPVAAPKAPAAAASKPARPAPPAATEAPTTTAHARRKAAAEQIKAPATRRELARDWLRERLGAGPVPYRELLTQMRAAGHKPRTCDRAAADLGVQVKLIPGTNKTAWELPGA